MVFEYNEKGRDFYEKRLTAILTAILCAGGVLQGLAAMAEEKDVTGTFIVVAVDQTETPEHYILKNASDHTTYFMSEEALSAYMTEKKVLTCGDILQMYTDYCATPKEGTNELEFLVEEGTNSQGCLCRLHLREC